LCEGECSFLMVGGTSLRTVLREYFSEDSILWNLPYLTEYKYMLKYKCMYLYYLLFPSFRLNPKIISTCLNISTCGSIINQLKLKVGQLKVGHSLWGNFMDERQPHRSLLVKGSRIRSFSETETSGLGFIQIAYQRGSEGWTQEEKAWRSCCSGGMHEVRPTCRCQLE